MKSEIRQFLNVFAVMQQVLKRFPLPFVFVVLATLSALLLFHDTKLIGRENIQRFYLFTLFAAMANVSFKLYVESHYSSRITYTIGSVILTLLTAAYAWVVHESDSALQYFLFFVLLLLSWIFAGYINRGSSNSSVWFFNYNSGVAIFFAGLAAIIFAGGLSLVLASIHYLFEIEVGGKLYGDIWIISVGLLFSTYVLANISTEFDFKDEQCDFPRGIRFIANYILLPLMYIYAAVLYAYFIKIGIQGELPRGNLGWMISALGIVGISTYLVIYPMRDRGTSLMLWFTEYFFYILIIPVLMLLFVLYIRISNYGLTENRYILLILAVWMLLLTASHIAYRLKKQAVEIKIIPMVLCALLLVTAYGPWSITQLPFESQLSRFESLLKKNNMLKEGQWYQANSKVSYKDRVTLSSIADYMARNDWRFKQIKPQLENIEVLDDKRRLYGRDIMRILDIEYISNWKARQKNRKRNSFNFSNRDVIGKELLKIQGYDYIGSINMYVSNNREMHNKLILDGDKNIEIVFKNNKLRLSLPGNSSINFDLDAFVKALKQKQTDGIERYRLTGKSSNKKYRASLLFKNITGMVENNGQVNISYMRYYLLLDKNN